MTIKMNRSSLTRIEILVIIVVVGALFTLAYLLAAAL